MTITIVGAGMAGLLAACMMRHRDPVVYEAQGTLPNNHSAVLRFSSPIVGDVLGVEFRKVNLVKEVLPWRNPVADALAYSYKCVGRYATDRSVVLPRRSEKVERWIAPTNLISIMADRVGRDRIKLGDAWLFTHQQEKVVSTIPMPKLMQALEYPRRDRVKFRHFHGVNLVTKIISCDAFASLYVPDPRYAFSRVSITGDEMIVEFPRCVEGSFSDQQWRDFFEDALKLMGVEHHDVARPAHDRFEMKYQSYHKIDAIDEGERLDFIHWASTEKKIAWQLGRFATWRPGLQLDDLVNDVRLIDKWMRSGSPEAAAEIHEIRK